MPINWSAAPETSGLKLKWADGWIEVFPEDEFAEECKDRPRAIRMYKNGERKPLTVEYTLRVSGRDAYLDYGGRFAEANKAPSRDIYIGETHIRFTDATRSVVASVRWRDRDKKVFRDNATWSSWDQPEAPKAVTSFRLPRDAKDERLRGQISAVLRPGQVRFRAQLLGIYKGRCALTGCDIQDALDAAHIVPFRGPHYDHVQNGIVMRADLHRLYDALRFSIEPKSRLVVLTNSLRSDVAYRDLQGSELWLPRRGSWRPSDVALRDHWRRFTRATTRKVRSH